VDRNLEHKVAKAAALAVILDKWKNFLRKYIKLSLKLFCKSYCAQTNHKAFFHKFVFLKLFNAQMHLEKKT
jgi:hypothetical protein